jgi:thioredoxin 1
MPRIIKTEAEYNEAIEKGNVVVDFFATWCMPCRKMGEVIEGVEKERSDIAFLKVDVDEHPEIAQRYNVYSIPQVEFLKDGKELGQLVGYRYREEFVSLLDKAYKA